MLKRWLLYRILQFIMEIENSVYFLDTETVYLLQTYGSSFIQSVHIASTPIVFHGIITNALHVYLIVHVNDVDIVIEKNERTELSLYKPMTRPNETIKSVPMNSPVTLAECIHRSIQRRMNETVHMGYVLEQFWGRYDLQKNNCQQLVFNVIRANGWTELGLESFNQGAEQFASHMEEHMKKTEAPPLAKLISSVFLQYMSNVTSKLVSQRIRDTPLKESSRCMTMDGVHIETFNDCNGCNDFSPEDACRRTEELYRSRLL